jgi:hypothetical protein
MISLFFLFGHQLLTWALIQEVAYITWEDSLRACIWFWKGLKDVFHHKLCKVGASKRPRAEELCVTLSDKKGCFACNERSHNLDQCKIKYKLVSATHQFGYATKFPFTVI